MVCPTGPFSTSNADDALSISRSRHHVLRAHGSPRRHPICGLRRGHLEDHRRDGRRSAACVTSPSSSHGFQTQTHPFGGFPPGLRTWCLSPTRTRLSQGHLEGQSQLQIQRAPAGLRHGVDGFSQRRPERSQRAVRAHSRGPTPRHTRSTTSWAPRGACENGLFDYQADVYFIHWSNIQVQETTADGAFVYLGNAGERPGQGYGIRVHRARSSICTRVSVRLLPGRVPRPGRDAAQYAANPTLGVSGDRFPTCRSSRLISVLDYTRPIRRNWSGMSAGDVTYRGAVNAYFASNTFNIPLSLLHAVGSAHRGDHRPWTVTAFARNLTDERAQVSAINSTPGSACAADGAAAHHRRVLYAQVLRRAFAPLAQRHPRFVPLSPPGAAIMRMMITLGS